MEVRERLEQSLKEMCEMREKGTIIPHYYDEEEDEIKQLNKENLKSIIKEILEEDIRTMPNCNGVEI